MINLKGKTVFITGASSGFGKATAYKFAEHGCNLILCARRFNTLKKIEQDIKKKYKIKILSFELDVRKQKDVKNKIAKFPAEWKKIDILINNAGLSRGLNKIQDGVLLDWEEMIDTNVK